MGAMMAHRKRGGSGRNNFLSAWIEEEKDTKNGESCGLARKSYKYPDIGFDSQLSDHGQKDKGVQRLKIRRMLE